VIDIRNIECHRPIHDSSVRVIRRDGIVKRRDDDHMLVDHVWGHLHHKPIRPGTVFRHVRAPLIEFGFIGDVRGEV
jgi:hypothetical protein